MSIRPRRHPDPYRDVDAEPDPERFIDALEARGRMPSQARLRRSFLRFVPIQRDNSVLEVGCGTGVVVRDLAPLVGPRGRVVGVDRSARLIRAARRLCRARGRGAPITLRVADGRRLPFPADRFDATLAVTVALHVAEPLELVKEMARVVRPGGRIGLQDQDFGTVAVEHPERELTARIMTGVAARIYADPLSGRRLPGLLVAAGLADVRLRTDVYQDTALEPYTQSFLARRAENAVRFGLVDVAAAQRWLDGFSELAATGTFVLTMNFYGAVGVKPGLR